MAFNSLDIFSGAGGLAAGLASSGFEVKCAYDVDERSCETLRRNHFLFSNEDTDFEVRHADLRQVEFAQYQDKIALLSGGPPCQPFSKGGKHNAHMDDRDLFPDAIRAVREVRPKSFVFENVSGLTRPNFRNYFEYIRLQLTHPEIQINVDENWSSHLRRLEDHHLSGSRQGLNYRLIVHRLNAADYGVPQNRNRIFFVGFRESLGIHWHFPVATHSKSALRFEMSNGDYWERNKVPKSKRFTPKISGSTKSKLVAEPILPWRTVREAISDLPPPAQFKFDSTSDELHVFRSGARVYKGHTGSRLDEPAKTLKAGVHGVPGGENMFVDDKGVIRYFTLRECARLQTFPDAYQFEGAWSSILKQMGNAVPVQLAQIIGMSVAEALQDLKKRGSVNDISCKFN